LKFTDHSAVVKLEESQFNFINAHEVIIESATNDEDDATHTHAHTTHVGVKMGEEIVLRQRPGGVLKSVADEVGSGDPLVRLLSQLSRPPQSPPPPPPPPPRFDDRHPRPPDFDAAAAAAAAAASTMPKTKTRRSRRRRRPSPPPAISTLVRVLAAGGGGGVEEPPQQRRSRRTGGGAGGGVGIVRFRSVLA
jgi:hypothetical protein